MGSVSKKEELRKSLVDCVEELTSTTGLCLEPRPLKFLKRMVRTSDAELIATYEHLVRKLKENHAQVRYLALLIYDELFMRSKVFRGLVAKSFDTFLQFTIGHRPNNPLPPPGERAALLREKSIEFVEKWNVTFGKHYRMVSLGYLYLKNNLRCKFPEVRLQQEAEAARKLEREAKTRAIFRLKYEQFLRVFKEQACEMDSTVTQVNECIRILVSSRSHDASRSYREDGFKFVDSMHSPRTSVNTFSGDEFEEDVEEEALGGRQYRLAALKVEAEEQMREEYENVAFLHDTLKELMKLVLCKFIPTTQEWLNMLSRVEVDDKQESEEYLKQVIDVRNRLVAAKRSCEAADLNFVLRDKNDKSKVDLDGDDVDWETNDDKVNEASVMETSTEGTIYKEAIGSKSITAKEYHISEESADIEPCTPTEDFVVNSQDALMRSLREKAPVLPWGSYLEYWGREDFVPVDPRGLQVDNHWGPVDSDALLPAERVREMSLQRKYYKPQALPDRPCKSPLRNGKLCPRRDHVKCPFHGIIIDRDAEGRPIVKEGEHVKGNGGNSNEIHVEVTPSADENAQEVSKSVGMQALKNLRARQTVERHLKRRKSNDVREHNASVLRDAALASSYHGIRESVGELLEGVSGTKNKGNRKRNSGLLDMLKSKNSTRDTLRQKLMREKFRSIK